MRAFYAAYPEIPAIVPQAVGQTESPLPEPVLHIPWGHNVILIEKVKELAERVWYARQAIEHGWSRAILHHQIESDLSARHGKAITNFSDTLPAPQSDIAMQTLKDPYIFSFLTLDSSARERDLEQGLMDHIQKFLLESGGGILFCGRQYPLEVEGGEYYLDLLFYHLRLRCFVVIDLKMEEFTPEHAGKMNFYLSVVDDRLTPTRGPAIDRSRIMQNQKKSDGRVRTAGYGETDRGIRMANAYCGIASGAAAGSCQPLKSGK